MRKLIAILLIVILVFPMALATLSVAAVSSWVLDRQFYTNLLSDTRLYEALLARDMPNYFQRRILIEADDVPLAAFARALRQVVTPEYMRGEALRLVDQAFDAIEGRATANFDFYLDIAPLKSALLGEAGPRFAQALAEAVPVCAVGQAPLAPNGVIMRCRAPDVSVAEAVAEIQDALPAFVAKTPDRINLARGPNDLRLFQRWWGPWAGAAIANGLTFAIVILLAMTGGLWFAAAWIGGEDSRERLLWLGWSLLVPALLIFGIGLAINGAATTGWIEFGIGQARFEDFEYSLQFRQALTDVARTAAMTVANGFLMSGGVSGAIALGLLAWGYSTPRQRRAVPVMAAPRPVPPTPAAAPSAQPALVQPVPAQPEVPPPPPQDEPPAQQPPSGTT